MDSKRRFDFSQARDAEQPGERRRVSKIVHDHKGTASVQWIDVPHDFEDRVPLEIEGARKPAAGTGAQPPARGVPTGPLSIKTEDTFNPYTRIPEGARKAGSTTRTDLRKLSAWIKLMRQLEEQRKRGLGEDEED